MAKEASFDIVSDVDMQEVDNAINQANKEISQRYDFKNSKSEISLEGQEIKILADDELKLKAVVDIVETRLIRRKVSPKNLSFGKVEDASNNLVRQIVEVNQGIATDKAKKIVKDIKNTKMKVQASIQGDQVRVSAKKIDDLQEIMQFLKGNDYGVELQFTNFR